MSNLTYEAFNLYVADQRKGRNVPQGVSSPLGLTFDAWIKTSGHVQHYMELAQGIRDQRPKSTKQLNDEHSQRLSQRLAETGAGDE